MKFDTVIIGGGLAGLISGIKLCQENKRCAIISAGQSALHFSSGSMDLLNTLPDGSLVTEPFKDISKLIEQNKKHPYSKLGENLFKELTKESESFLRNLGLSLKGNNNTNHYRVTPLGELKSTWLTAEPYAISETPKQLPWKSVSIFNMSGFLDFYPDFIASALLKLGTKAIIKEFTLDGLDRLRRNPSELRSSNITNVMDQLNDQEFNQLIQIIKEGSTNSEAILFPAILGLNNESIIKDLEKAIGKPFYLLPTLPPSVIGIKIQQFLHQTFINLGGVYMLGDNITHGDIVNGELKKIYSFNHGDIPFQAQNFILATGSYFSQGLVANRKKVYEPIFNLDIEFNDSRVNWYDNNVFNSQPYMAFGIKTNHNFQGQINNQTINNLYVIGAGLESFNAMKEGCGAGVSILTALHVAKTILRK